MDIMPRADGHVLVIPKNPARNLLDAAPEDLARAIATVQKVARAVKAGMKADGITLQQFNERAGGQVVFHLHFHILPRWDGVQLRPHTGEMAPNDVLQRTPRRSGRRSPLLKGSGLRTAAADERLDRLDDRRRRGAGGVEAGPDAPIQPTQMTGTRIQPRISSNSRRRRRRCQRFSRHDSLRAGAGGAAGAAGAGAGSSGRSPTSLVIP